MAQKSIRNPVKLVKLKKSFKLFKNRNIAWQKPKKKKQIQVQKKNEQKWVGKSPKSSQVGCPLT